MSHGAEKFVRPEAPPDFAAESPPRGRFRQAVLAGTVPAVLVAVSLVQTVLVNTQDLTPWKGGGFGMFASVDRAENRAVRVFLETPSGELPALVTSPEEDPVIPEQRLVRVRNLPDTGAASDLADELGNVEWVYADVDGRDVAVPRAAAAAVTTEIIDEGATSGRSGGAAEDEATEDERAVQVDGVRVEVWRLRFRDDDVAIEPALLTTVSRSVS